jgi:hypothetical protein
MNRFLACGDPRAEQGQGSQMTKDEMIGWFNRPQETEQIVQPATRPAYRRRDEPAFESSPFAVSV